MKGKCAVVGVLAERAAVFGRRSTNACLPALVDKLGDAKVLTDSLNTQPSLSFYDNLLHFVLPHTNTLGYYSPNKGHL